MSPTAIQIEKLCKNYGSTAALRGVDLEIPAGQFFGLLGPNGAGKTTLINSIVGLVKPSAGTVRVFGHSVAAEPRAAKAFIGFSPQEINTDRFFNLRRTLEFQGGFHGQSRASARQLAQELLEQFGLAEKASMQFYKLSGGMQKRLMVARALMSRPRLLILDEPTAGVDVEQRHELWKYLRNLNKNGTTILLTTHYIDEAEALCERIGIIDHGQIIELGSPQELIDKYCDSEVEISVEGKLEAEDFSGIPDVRLKDGRVHARAKRLGAAAELLLKRILAQPGRRVLDINVKKGNLEEVFIRLTGKTLREAENGLGLAQVAELPA
ncbi:MAG TPA: ABC transporter ATP-binding protein [Deltaproteobacteria bacterium]|nr:ABC transporter ATP-binding protein [Deltaproteobacteria bacterium]